jgi:hypothetical protein
VGLHSIVLYGTEPVTEATPTVAAADLTLCIGLGFAFIIFLAVIFVIIKLLRRKGGPYPSYGLTPEGKTLKKKIVVFNLSSQISLPTTKTPSSLHLKY